MSVELRNAPNLTEPQGFSHFSIAPTGPIVHLAGQGGTDAAGVVGKDLTEQTEWALRNLVEALKAAGGSPADLVKLTILVVGWNESKVGDLVQGFTAARASGPIPLVPMTLVGVQSLFYDDMLVEIEGVAVLTPTT